MVKIAVQILTWLVAGYHHFLGYGYFNDESNIAECTIDGGDCCANPNVVGDGVCDDENKNP